MVFGSKSMRRLATLAWNLRRDVMTLWFALKHPDTPWYARVLAGLIAAYALSPVDFIPDFIPVLGYLDDLIVVPAGVWLVLHIVPAQVLIESRALAEQWFQARRGKPRSIIGLLLVLCLWALVLWLAWRWLSG